MKREKHFAPPSSAGIRGSKGQRLRPLGKHAKGRAPKLSFGNPVNPGFTKGDYKLRAAKAKWKASAIGESQREANRIANERALNKAYREFYSTPAGRKFASEFGKSYKGPSRTGPKRNNQPDVEFHDPADVPDSVGCGSHNGKKIVRTAHHPVDDLEPLRNGAVVVEGISEEEIAETSETFSLALRWALDVDEITNRGRRAIVLIGRMRPDLANGFKRYDFEQTLFDSQLSTLNHQLLESTGAVFSRYLEWMRRGPNLAAIGERLDLTAYTLRPELLPSATLARLGAIVGKTRQAKDKLVGDQRDTFAGIKALQARPEITRDRCRASQLTTNSHE